ncbi:hypothetical protein LCGC14_3021460, partial [marine sediment metagenome]
LQVNTETGGLESQRVKVRTLTDPTKIFDWKLGKIYQLPVKKHTKLEGVYMLLYEWKDSVHTYIEDEDVGDKVTIDKFTKGEVVTFGNKTVDPKIEVAGIMTKEANDIPSRLGFSTLSEVALETEGSQLAVLDKVGKDEDEFKYQDHKDEDQIMDEIKGRMIDEYVYQFEVDVRKNGKVVGTRIVTGVSYAGIKALVTGRGGYSITKNTIVEVNGIWYAKVMVHDNINDMDGLGLGECSLQETFARQKAMGKALRNAYRSIMDEGQFIAFIKQWKKQKEIEK